jgi:hypothetical protein
MTFSTEQSCHAKDYHHGNVIDAMYQPLDTCISGDGEEYDFKYTSCTKENGLERVSYSSNDGSCDGSVIVEDIFYRPEYACLDQGHSSLLFGVGWMNFECSATHSHSA